MPHYNLIHTPSATAVYSYEADGPLVFDGSWGGADYQSVEVSIPPTPVNTEVVPITIPAFRNRFGSATKVAITSAAMTDPIVRTLMDDLYASPYVDLNRRDANSAYEALQILMSKNLVTSEQVTTILGTPPAPSEYYRGEL